MRHTGTHQEKSGALSMMVRRVLGGGPCCVEFRLFSAHWTRLGGRETPRPARLETIESQMNTLVYWTEEWSPEARGKQPEGKQFFEKNSLTEYLQHVTCQNS